MSRFGSGLAVAGGSSSGGLPEAAEQAVAQALEPLAGRTPDLVVVFAHAPAAGLVEAVGSQVAELTGAAALLGCSAAGVIGGPHGVEGASAVSVFAAVLPGVRLRTFHLEVMPGEGGSAVVGMPELSGESGELAVVLADPYSFPTDAFLGRAATALPGLQVVGGQAAALQGQGSTRLLLDGRAVDRGLVGVLMQGAGARAVVSQGCRPVGPAMTVTAAAGNVLSGLAGEPAVRRLERLLAELPPADQALASAGLHLGIAADEYAEDHDFLVRGLLGVAPGGGLVVGDLVEVGQTVRFQVRDADAADADLQVHLAAHRASTHDAPVGGALLFSCLGRGAGLFGASYGGADHDPALVRSGLAASAVAGFFADGELGPVAGRNHLHTFTASLLVFDG